jgi:hypothetical protein
MYTVAYSGVSLIISRPTFLEGETVLSISKFLLYL